MADKATFEAFKALTTERFSCRAFLPDAVPQGVIAEIVETAQQIPSWCNAQPWQLIITRGEETDRFRKFMYETAQKTAHNSDVPFPSSYDGRYQTRRRVCGWQLYNAVGVGRGDRAASARQMMENYNLFGAPHVALITSDRALGEYGVMDCGGFVTGFTLAAEAHGVGSVAQASIAGFSNEVRDYFDIPEDRLVVAAISFGYKDKAHPANQFRTERAKVEDVVDWR